MENKSKYLFPSGCFKQPNLLYLYQSKRQTKGGNEDEKRHGKSLGDR